MSSSSQATKNDDELDDDKNDDDDDDDACCIDRMCVQIQKLLLCVFLVLSKKKNFKETPPHPKFRVLDSLFVKKCDLGTKRRRKLSAIGDKISHFKHLIIKPPI